MNIVDPEGGAGILATLGCAVATACAAQLLVDHSIYMKNEVENQCLTPKRHDDAFNECFASSLDQNPCCWFADAPILLPPPKWWGPQPIPSSLTGY